MPKIKYDGLWIGPSRAKHDNDGTNPITGTFNGLPYGSTIAGNGKTWYIYYVDKVILSSWMTTINQPVCL